MIRFIFVVIFLITYLILSIPVFFIEWLIGKCNRNARDYSSLRIVTLLLDTQQFHFEYQSRERLDLATGFS